MHTFATIPPDGWRHRAAGRPKQGEHMESGLSAALAAVMGTLAGGGISYLLNRQQFSHQIRALREQYKADFMAEETARHFLSHKSFTDRSFETLQKNLGGFNDDELRRILVRAGAIRVYREDGSEWWRLLSRMDEFIEKKNGQQA
jgi:hypothetical protein